MAGELGEDNSLINSYCFYLTLHRDLKSTSLLWLDYVYALLQSQGFSYYAHQSQLLRFLRHLTIDDSFSLSPS